MVLGMVRRQFLNVENQYQCKKCLIFASFMASGCASGSVLAMRIRIQESQMTKSLRILADPDSYPKHCFIIFFVCCQYPLRQNCLDTLVNLMFQFSLTIFLPAVTLQLCSGSGSVNFWASRIRIRQSEVPDQDSDPSIINKRV